MVPKDAEEAFQWFQKSAELGNPAAVNMVGRCYMDGNGVEQDQEKAFQYFQKASEAGDESAMFNLADCYLNGAVRRTGSAVVSESRRSEHFHCPVHAGNLLSFWKGRFAE